MKNTVLHLLSTYFRRVLQLAKWPVTNIPMRGLLQSRRILIGLIVLVLCIVLGIVFIIRHHQNRQIDLPAIIENGRLEVLTDNSSMGFVSTRDTVYGFQYEIVKAFADSLGVELVISQKNNMAECVADLTNKNFDLLANFSPVSSQWNEQIAFSEPFFTTKLMLVQRKPVDSTSVQLINRHIQLEDDTISICKNSPHKMRLLHLSDEIAGPIQIAEIKNTTTEDLVKLVAAGKIRYTVCEQQLCAKIQRDYPMLDTSLPLGFEQNYSWAVRKDCPLLLDKMNEFLDDFIGSEAYWKIYRKYY